MQTQHASPQYTLSKLGPWAVCDFDEKRTGRVTMECHLACEVTQGLHDGNARSQQVSVRLKEIVLAIHVKSDMKTVRILCGLAFGKRT